MNTQVINGVEGGRHITNGPLTTTITESAAPGLLKNAIDQRIVKVKPYSTPLDQISRCGIPVRCNSMTAEYYLVDHYPTMAKGRGQMTPIGTPAQGESQMYYLNTDNNKIFSPSETIMVPEVQIAEPSGRVLSLTLYVVDINDSGLKVIPLNEGEIETDVNDFDIVRMGRAATELDVQSPQYQALPVKASNDCQIFKMQVEESTLSKIANREIGWNFSDKEEAAIVDMRMGMEKNFLFGIRRKIFDPEKGEYVYCTGGIWNQADNEFTIDTSNFTEATLIELCSKAFSDVYSSKRKILLAGSRLLELISKINLNRTLRGGETLVKWGLKFHEIESNFGSLFVVHSEVFDHCGHGSDGMIIDPDYITKYVHVPFRTDRLDLRRSGTRNTSAVVITEASCLALRYPKAHMRVVAE